MGQTGQKILRAIIDGERDPQRLASFRDRRVKASADTIAASLEGTWREEHLFALEQAVQRYDFLDQQLEDCEARITAQIDSLTPPDDPTGGGTVDETPVAAVSSTKTSRGAKSVASNEKAMSQALHAMMSVDLTAIPTSASTPLW